MSAWFLKHIQFSVSVVITGGLKFDICRRVQSFHACLHTQLETSAIFYSEIVCHFLGNQNAGVKLLRRVCTKLLVLNINKFASSRPAFSNKVKE